MKKHCTALLTFAIISIGALAQPAQKIYSYAIGDWRNGPVVTISPLFETTEAFSTLQLIARVKKEFAPFDTIMDIDIQRFATVEEGELSRVTLKGKYERRNLKVDLMDPPKDAVDGQAPDPPKQ